MIAPPPPTTKIPAAGRVFFVICLILAVAVAALPSDPDKKPNAETPPSAAPASAVAAPAEPPPEPIPEQQPRKVGKPNEANRRAEAEAKSFLKPCGFPGDRQSMCLIKQRNFVEQYILAKAGDANAMGSTASSFRPISPMTPNFADAVERNLGLPVSLMQACVWSVVRANTPLDGSQATMTAYIRRSIIESNLRRAAEICAELPQQEQLVARRRSEALLQELRTNPAVYPAAERDPPRPYKLDPRAEAEARTFLRPCPPEDEEWGIPCLNRREEFVDEYVRAKAGDPDAIETVGLTFYEGGYKAFRPLNQGVEASNARSCAWDTVLANRRGSADDRAGAARSCARVPDAERPAALALAAQITREIATAPARMPPPRTRRVLSPVAH